MAPVGGASGPLNPLIHLPVPRRKRPPKSIPLDELASILAYADLQSDKAAADKFGVSERTLQRYRARVRSGAHPQLAELVEQRKYQTAERCANLLVEVYEKGLAALGRRIEDSAAESRMKDRDLVGAIHILGNQLVTRKVLIEDEQQPSGCDRPSAAPAAAGSRGPGTAAGEAGRTQLH